MSECVISTRGPKFVEPAHAKEYPTDWQAAPAPDGGEGQTLSVCKVSQAKPQACETSGAVVLPKVPCRDRRKRGPHPVKIPCFRGWSSVVGSVKPRYLKSHGHDIIEPRLDHDDFQRAFETAQQAAQDSLIEVGRDHRLADPEPLEELLQSVKGRASVGYSSARVTLTESTSNLNSPAFLSLSMSPKPTIWSGCTGPMP